MKRALPLIVAALAGMAAYLIGAEQALFINVFGGIDSDNHPLAVDDGMSQGSYNVITDEAHGVLPREGYISYSTNTATALWEFAKSDGTRYVIAHSGNNLKADAGLKTFATLVSTVAAGVPTVGAQLGDYFYFANTVDGLKRWNGSTTTVADAGMTVDKLVTWKGRLVASGKAGYERTLYLSKLYDGTTWTLETNPTDDGPTQITVGGALDENITALFASYKDILIWMKNTSFGGLYGSRRSNFILRTHSESVGTSHPATIKDCDGYLRWLGPRRTAWQFDGSGLVKISEPVDTLFDDISNGESNSRTVTITSKADYDAGTLTALSSSITEGSILLATATLSDTDGADFGTGNLGLSFTTTTTSGKLSLRDHGSTDSATAYETRSFLLGSGYYATGAAIKVTVTSTGTKTGTMDCNIPFYILVGTMTDVPMYLNTWADSAGLPGSELSSSYVGVCTPDALSGGWSLCNPDYNVLASLPRGTVVWVGVKTIGYSFGRVPYPLPSSVMEGFAVLTPSGWTTSPTLGGSIAGTVTTSLRYFSWLIPAEFTSRSISIFEDSRIKSSVALFDENSWDGVLSMETSADGVSWTTATWLTWLAAFEVPTEKSGSSTLITDNYLRYRLIVSSGTGGFFGKLTDYTKTPHLEYATINAVASTGAFVSASQTIGPNISSWGVFQRDETLNDGTITYGFYSDTDTAKTIGGDGLPVVGTFTSSQTITNNSIPTISTAPYSFFSGKFAITASTQNPTNSRLSITYNEGSDLKAQAAWTKERYWLAVGVNSATNNRIFVFDRKQQWQDYRDLSAAAMVNHNSSVLFANTSGIWQAETGTTDNGTAITSMYETRAYMPTGIDVRSYPRDLYMTTKRSDATLGTEVFFEGETTAVTLGTYTMNVRNGFQNFKLPFTYSDAQQGRSLSIRWTVTASDQWQILNGSLYFDQDKARD